MITDPTDPTDDRFEQVLFECLLEMEESGSRAVDSACDLHPDLAPRLRSHITTLERAGLLSELAEPALPERLGEYRLIARLGGGGMGVVFLARQESLGREVALKLVRPDLLHYPGTRQRFQREVEIVAQLQHPGIIQVHGFGEQDGVPYLAMERVHGATLAEVLGAFDGRDPVQLTGNDLSRGIEAVLHRKQQTLHAREALAPTGGSWHETSIALVAQVARALDHAHRHRVLHRDVKPSNVLVTLDGRALLFDFGLSRIEGAREITRPHQFIGSLPYAAPEVLSGAPADRRTDVYGLAATLYELITLEPPFRGRDELQLRAKILRGEHASLRRANLSVPVELDWVVGKALERDPSKRYETAADFARDLESVLELRPVSARPSAPGLRLRRWVQRRPAHAVALALAVLLLVLGPSAIAIQRSLAGRHLELALQEMQAERTRAEENLDRALDAVWFLSAEIDSLEVDGVPGLGEARARALGKALAVYEELLPQRVDDARMIADRARILHDMGSILMRLGREIEAEAPLREAANILEVLQERRPELIHLQARVRTDLGRALAWKGELSAALEQELRAVALLEGGIAGGPASGCDLIRARLVLSESLRNAGRAGEAREHLERALSLAEQRHLAEPSLDTRDQLTGCLSMLAVLASDREDEVALEMHARAFEIMRVVLDEELVSPAYLSRFATLCTNYGISLGHSNRFDEQERVARVGIQTLERLAREHPYDAAYKRRLIGPTFSLALSLIGRDRAEEAVPLFVRRAEVQAELVASRPDSFEDRASLGQAQSNTANLFLELGRIELAEHWIRRAVDTYEELLVSHPAHGGVRTNSAVAELIQFQVLARLDELLDPSDIEDLVLARAPESPQAWIVAAITLSIAAEMAAERGGAFEAELAEKALDALERAIAHGYRNVERLGTTRELDALRTHARFEQLVATIRVKD